MTINNCIVRKELHNNAITRLTLQITTISLDKNYNLQRYHYRSSTSNVFVTILIDKHHNLQRHHKTKKYYLQSYHYKSITSNVFI